MEPQGPAGLSPPRGVASPPARGLEGCPVLGPPAPKTLAFATYIYIYMYVYVYIYIYIYIYLV